MAQAKNLRAVSDRIETLIEEVRAFADPHARETAEELVQSLVELYGAGLARILEIVQGNGPGATELFERFSADDLVASLFLLHGLHPQTVESRVLAALEKVRPYLGSHGGSVPLLGVEDGVVRLRLEGSCEGCPASAVTMKLSIERAIEEAAPEVTRIEVEGAEGESETEPAAAPPPKARNSLVQIGSTGSFSSPLPGDGSAGGRGGRGVRVDAGQGSEERCELCGQAIPSEHSHLVHLEKRTLLCACRACFLLFTSKGAGGGKYRAVPERYLQLRQPVLTEDQWDQAQVPVNLAFFFFNSSLGRTVAFYPSPAGATESLLSLETWQEVERANPVLAGLMPDVEALLVFKRPEGFEGYVVPIDACYELVGIVRRRWKGFHGGEEAWQDIEAFFSGLSSRSERPEALLRNTG